MQLVQYIPATSALLHIMGDATNPLFSAIRQRCKASDLVIFFMASSLSHVEGESVVEAASGSFEQRAEN